MYTSDIDYPACHSMDTDWFAIDKNGHVALMVSSEPGSLPLPAEIQGWSNEVLCRNLTQVDERIYWMNLSKTALDRIERLCVDNKEPIDYDYFTGFIQLKTDVRFKDLKIAIVLDKDSDCQIVSFERNIYYIQLEYIEEINILLKDDIDSGKIKYYLQTKDVVLSKPQTEEDYQHTFEYLIGLYFYEADYSEVYDRIGVPQIPLSVSQLQRNSELIDIKDIDFSEKQAFNPMQYTSCRTWGKREVSPINKDYCSINIEDDRTATVRMSNEYLLTEKISPYSCYKCFPDRDKSSSNFFYQQIHLLSDYPRVMILSDYPRKSYDKGLDIDLDLSTIKIDTTSIYRSFAIKCMPKNNEQVKLRKWIPKRAKENPSLKYLMDCFKNCHTLFEEELSMLCIQLIICVPNTCLEGLLKSHYKIEENKETDIHQISILEKDFHLVYWNESLTENQRFIEQIQSILKQGRDIPDYPRCID